MSAQGTRRIAPWREGQSVLARATFTRGEGMGYTTHHEGVRHVARVVVQVTTKTRGPPAANR
jgi:hypothetical protein